MNPRIKAQWLDALLSGEYVQGTGYLRKAGTGDSGRDEYCCLGVLCDLYVNSEESSANPRGPVKWNVCENDATIFELGGRAAYLPNLVMEWAGLSSGDGEFVSDGGVRYGLSELNDEGRTFEEIAEVIMQKF